MGENDSYQLGLGDDDNRSEPTLVNFKEPLKDIACGGSHALALTSSGEVYSWGEARYGQLGLGKNLKDAYCQRPIKIDGKNNIDIPISINTFLFSNKAISETINRNQ